MARGKVFSNPYLSGDYGTLRYTAKKQCSSHIVPLPALAPKFLRPSARQASRCAATRTVFEHRIFDAATIDCVLQFIYTDDYVLPKGEGQEAADVEATVEEKASDMHQLAAHVLVHAAGDLYDIAALRDLAASKFVNGAQPLKENDRSIFLDLVARVVRHTMPTEDNALRKKVLQMALQQKEQLLQDQTFVELLFERNDLDDFVPQFICGAVTEFNDALVKQHELHQTDMDKTQLEVKNAQTARDEALQAKDKALADVTRLRTDRNNGRQQLSTKQRELEDIQKAHEKEVTKLRDNARQQQKDSDSKLKEARTQQSAAETRARSAQEILDKRLQGFARIPYCNKCKQSPFSYILDDVHTARCQSCNTRHNAIGEY
ncbi:hypothetical protein CB0940_02881 [Cercospora beticola]|uniref:BTB domain-containing protein n=1 Tax=Cercospora beticola TaxID=122368 RepID=A0A2G5I5N3_CERBT|nr:hypothetical protein CB0940_02881 [Cercospora beticola]PIB00069.1 hypothetical protein CB0940_02881 [Cercospora beticola]WPB00034.1 hypothetical protein RHO25_004653 [Cercospora beticola]CAK1361789.1 unnamed protein product [Cercospora beticola]